VGDRRGSRPALGVELLQRLGHRGEVAQQAAGLVGASQEPRRDLRAGREVSPGDPAGGGRQRGQRSGQPPRDKHPAGDADPHRDGGEDRELERAVEVAAPRLPLDQLGGLRRQPPLEVDQGERQRQGRGEHGDERHREREPDADAAHDGYRADGTPSR
jgi:hypothetical protein